MTVEHVLETLRRCMGATHSLMRGLAHVGTEMSLHVLAYHLERAISLLGMARTMKTLRLLAV